MMRRALRRLATGNYLAIAAGALLAYTLLGFFAAPPVIRWYVPRYIQERLGCWAVLEGVRVNPFLLTFEARGLDLFGSDGMPLLGFDRLFIDLELTDLFHRPATVRELRLESPSVHIVFDTDGGINLARLAPKPEEPGPPPDPPEVLLRNVSIAGGAVHVTDLRRNTQRTLNLRDVDIHLESLSTVRDQTGTCALFAQTESGETLTWQGEVGLAPFRSTGRIVLASIEMATLLEFVPDGPRLDSAAGKLDISTNYCLDAAHSPMQLTLGELRIGLSDLALRLPDAREHFLQLRRLEVDSARFDFTERVLDAGRLLVDGGSMGLRIDGAGRVNLQELTPRSPSKEGRDTATPQAHDPPSADTPPWKVAVETLELRDVALGLEDLSRTEPLVASISSFSAQAGATVEAGSTMAVVLKDMAAELKGMRIERRGAQAPLFEAQGLVIQGGELDLAARAVTVARVGLSDARLDLAREPDGRLNIERLLATGNGSPGGAESGSAPSREGMPWKLLIQTVDLKGFHAELSDLAAAPGIKPLVRIAGFDARLTELGGRGPMGVEASFGVEPGGRVALQGKLDPSSLSLEAGLKVTGLVLTPLQPYLAPHITLTLQSAAVSTEGTLRYGSSGARASYTGSLRIEQVSLNEPGSNETYLGWGTMQTPEVKLTLEPNRLEAQDIRLSKPVGRLIIAEDRTINLAKIFKDQPDKGTLPPSPGRPAAPRPTPGQASGAPFPFHIGRVRIDAGDMVFADLSLTPKFMTRIHDLKGTVSRISSARNSLAQIRLDGQVDQYGYAKISGALDFSDVRRSTDVNMVFQNVEMASITPYSGKFAGRKINAGKLSLDLNYRIQNSRLVGENKIVVDHLVLGERVESPDAMNLPLDLAVALLQDSRGRINIGLPVTGDLNNPQFSLGPLIRKALGSLLTGIVKAPFRALGSLFSGGTEQLEAVDFEAGKAELLPPEKEKLKKISEVLKGRPKLQLVLQGRYSPEADGLELRQAAVERTVAARLGEKRSPLDLGAPKVRRALEALFTERFGSKALDELDRDVREGKIKPPAGGEAQETRQGKQGRLARAYYGMKLYKVVPGGKSPEESERLAGELFTRLVASEPLPEEELRQLASERARSIGAELQGPLALPADRLRAVEPATGDHGLSARLSLDALPGVR